jgi:hypothetical protein
MRASILIAIMALTLAACGRDQSNNTANVDQSLSAENIVSNDVTAIDAVTASDANMAADVNYLPEVSNGENSGAPATGSPGRTVVRNMPASNGAAADSAPAPAPATQNSATPTTATANNAT